jgi:hypothetical protein
VEDPCCQGGLCLGLFKDLWEVFHLSGSAENTPLKKVEIASGYIDNKNPVTKSRLWQNIWRFYLICIWLKYQSGISDNPKFPL